MIKKVIESSTHVYEVLDYMNIDSNLICLDSGIVPSSSATIELVGYHTELNTNNNAALFWTSINSTGNNWNEANTWYAPIASNQYQIKPIGYTSVVSTGIRISNYLNTKVLYRITADGKFDVINYDTLASIASYDYSRYVNSSYTNRQNLYIFDCPFQSDGGITRFRCYEIKIYDTNLVRNFVPVRRLSDDVCGFYDYVTESFFTNYKSATLSGMSKSVPEYIDTYNTIAVTIGKFGNDINRIYHGADLLFGTVPPSPSPIPAQYVVHDYIKSQGSSNTSMSYINTGFRPSNNTRLEFDMEFAYPRSTYRLYGGVLPFGAWSWTNPSTKQGGELTWTILFGDQNNIRFMGSRTQTISSNECLFTAVGGLITDTNPHTMKGTMDTSNINVTIDGVDYSLLYDGAPWSGLDGTANTISELYMFAGIWTDQTRDPIPPKTFTTIKMKSFKIYDNNVLQRDYVPVYDTVTQKYGMYETVNQTFNPSIGSYDFTI